MCKKILLIMICMLYGTYAATAQQSVSDICSQARVKQTVLNGTGAKTTIATAEEDYYDIQHLKFNIELTNTSTAVSGNVITTAKVAVASMNEYAFELNPLLVIDSFKLNGVLLPVTTTGTIRKATIGTALSSGTVFTAQVFYHGSSTAGNGQFFTGGLHPLKDGDFTLMYSISDKDFACDWWPCKQSLKDKIDSVDMWVTVDDTLKVGSNGLLKNMVSLPGNKKRYEWKTSYPIDYYLISVAVAPYNEYSYYMHFTDGSNDSMLVQNFVYNTPGHLNATARAALDSTGLIIDHFSQLFGRYPFDKEKYGHCMSPLLGGMEHQTMTTMGTGAYSNVTLIAHELGHQWWGNNVTYASWADIWLSEGITSYCEQLFIEKFHNPQELFGYRSAVIARAMDNSGSLYVTDTTTTNRIFYNALTYNKGAAVTHMLRYVAPEDSLFFRAARKYQQQFRGGIAYTTDLQNIFEQEYGIDLDTFFRQWVYGIGNPVYSSKWYQDKDGKIGIQINQSTTAPSSVSCFWMSLEVKLVTDKGDKIVRLYNNTNSMTNFIYCGDSIVQNIIIDPNNHIIKTAKKSVKDSSIMSITTRSLDEVSVYPNPAKTEWLVNHLPSKTHCTLTDIAGRVIWQQTCNGNVTIPAAELQKGVYMLRADMDNGVSKYIRLVKN